VANAIRAREDASEATRREPMFDRACSEADGEELPASDDSVLARSELRNRLVVGR